LSSEAHEIIGDGVWGRFISLKGGRKRSKDLRREFKSGSYITGGEEEKDTLRCKGLEEEKQ